LEVIQVLKETIYLEEKDPKVLLITQAKPSICWLYFHSNFKGFVVNDNTVAINIYACLWEGIRTVGKSITEALIHEMTHIFSGSDDIDDDEGYEYLRKLIFEEKTKERREEDKKK
jgi:hypothetical protein